MNICTEEVDDEIIKEYELKYKEATEIYNKIDAISASCPPLHDTNAPTESSPIARLPRIDLVTFEGDLFS